MITEEEDHIIVEAEADGEARLAAAAAVGEIIIIEII
jgi:hypothetical protein